MRCPYLFFYNIIREPRDIDFVSSLDNYIWSIQWPKKRTEPNCVRALTQSLPKFIQDAANNAYGKGYIKVGAAFIHQKPIARFFNKRFKKAPELGDILIVCRDKQKSLKRYNSVLFQAKMSNKPEKYNIRKSELHQYRLYSQWPRFKYERAGTLDGQTRDILPKSVTQGANYLTLYKRDPSIIFTAPTCNPLRASSCFSVFLGSFIHFGCGRTFDIDVNTNDEWSRMIMDLLMVSFQSNASNKNNPAKQRLFGDVLFNFVLKLNCLCQEEGEERDERDGMTVICIDVKSNSVED